MQVTISKDLDSDGTEYTYEVTADVIKDDGEYNIRVLELNVLKDNELVTGFEKVMAIRDLNTDCLNQLLIEAANGD